MDKIIKDITRLLKLIYDAKLLSDCCKEVMYTQKFYEYQIGEIEQNIELLRRKVNLPKT